MRTLAFTCVSVLALAAAPAMAKSTNQSNQQGKSSSGQTNPQIHAMNQEKLRTNLQKAGFSNIKVLDAAYLVQADTSDGNQVMLFINPPSTSSGAQASATGGSDGSSGSGSTSQNKPTSSN